MAIRKIVSIVLAAIVFVWSAATAQADDLVISGTTGRLGDGGEFKISEYDSWFLPPASVVTMYNGGSTAGDFRTFCVERNEFITLGSTYSYTVDLAAVHGGVGGGDPDYIGDATGRLFYTFWSNQWGVASTLGYGGATYSYSDTTQRGKDGRDLQYTIWYLENELTDAQWYDYWHDGKLADGSSSGASSHQKAKDMYDYSQNVAWSDLGQGGWSGAGGVRALNLYSGSTFKQSQLVVVPLPPAAVMGFALLGSLAILTGLRKRYLANRSAS